MGPTSDNLSAPNRTDPSTGNVNGGFGSSSYNARESSGIGGYGGSGYGGGGASVGSGGAWGGSSGNVSTFSGNTLGRDSSAVGGGFFGGISSLVGGISNLFGGGSTGSAAPQQAPGSSTDASVVASLAVRDAVQAAKTSAALKSDSGGISTLNVGPMGTPVSIGGGQISGAIRDVASKTYKPSEAALQAVTRGPGSVSGMIPGNMDPRAAQQSLYGITNSFNDTMGTSLTPEEVSKMARTIAGEAAGESRFGQAAAANSMVNRIAGAEKKPDILGYMGGSDINSLLSQYDAAGLRGDLTPNQAYLSADPGTSSYQNSLRAINDAINPQSEFSTTASPTVLNATHYYNPDSANPSWGLRSGRPFEKIGGHLFGNAENISGDIASIRSGIAGLNTTGSSTISDPDAAPPGYFSQFAMDDADIARLKQEVIDDTSIPFGDKLKMQSNIGALSGFMGPITRDQENVASIGSGQGETVVPTSDTGTLPQEETSVSPSQQGLTGAQEMAVKSETADADTALKSLGIVGRGLGKLYDWNTKDDLNEYVDATSQQKKAMEEANPALVKWAGVVGVSPYHDQSYYDNWAESMGLRAPETRFGGPDSGTKSLPMIYADWSQGRNIPSPNDPLYTEYKQFMRAQNQRGKI